MVSNIACWAVALGIMLSDSVNRQDLYIKTLLAMGFVFLGILSKAIDVYRETHVIEIDEETLDKIKQNT